MLAQRIQMAQNHKKEFLELYKSLVSLKVKHRVVMEDDYQKMLLEEEVQDSSKE